MKSWRYRNHYYLDSSGRMVGQSRGVILLGSRRIAALPFAMKRQLIKEAEALPDLSEALTSNRLNA